MCVHVELQLVSHSLIEARPDFELICPRKCKGSRARLTLLLQPNGTLEKVVDTLPYTVKFKFKF